MNKVVLIGNAGKDAEHMQAGNSEVAKFSIATTERYKDKNGEIVTNTEWHNITCWGGLAKFASQYVQKGVKYAIEGKIKYGSYEKDGITHRTTEIVASSIEFCEGKKDGAPSQPASKSVPDRYTQEQNDDLPF